MQVPEMARFLSGRNVGLAVIGLALLVGLIGWGTRVAVDGEEPAQHFQLAVKGFHQNDLGEVERRIEKLRDLPEYQAHVHLLEGMLLLRSRQPYEAMEQFGLAGEHPDTRALAFTLIGETLYRGRNYRGAIENLQKAIDLDSQQIYAYRWLAATYYDIGAMNDALVQLKKIAELDPLDPRPQRLRGLIFKDFERYGEAVEEYEESLRRQPDQPAREEILFELAQCLFELRQPEQALETLQDCQPTPDVLSLRAECEYARGNEEIAKQLLADALVLSPDHLDALQLQATIALEAGDGEHAVEILKNAVESNPKEFTVHYNLMQAYRLLGKEEQALEQSERMQELRDLRMQFTELHRQAMQDPTDAEVRYQIGVIARKLDKSNLAHNWFLAALALDPTHSGAQQALMAPPQ